MTSKAAIFMLFITTGSCSGHTQDPACHEESDQIVSRQCYIRAMLACSGTQQDMTLCHRFAVNRCTVYRCDGVTAEHDHFDHGVDKAKALTKDQEREAERVMSTY